MDEEGYRESAEKIIVDTSNIYGKICYISFNNPHHIVVEMLKNVKVDSNKFIVIDASTDAKEVKAINKTTYIVNTSDLFDVYL